MAVATLVSIMGMARLGRTFRFSEEEWHAVVEVVRELSVLPDHLAAELHRPFNGAGLSDRQCALVSGALRVGVLPRYADDDLVHVDGVSVSGASLRDFASFLEECGGFTV